jgi:hypothetical protein
MRQNKEAESKISQEYLKSILDYDPETGIFTWKHRPREHFKTEPVWKSWNTRYSGAVAGGRNGGEYIIISINRRSFLAHRLSWLYMIGEFPQDQIDHINGVRDDNRIVNLRSVTNSENHRNQKKPKSNSSGVTGICWHKRKNKWHAYIRTDDKRIHLGYFDNIFEAACARKSAENKHGFHANHGR